jgi:hypothetical protein
LSEGLAAAALKYASFSWSVDRLDLSLTSPHTSPL